MRKHLVRLLGVLACIAVIVGCGTADDQSNKPSGSTAATTTDNGDLRWGDGDYGVVLAHGAAFDAASWTAQATAIARHDTTVVAVEDISPENIRSAVLELHAEGIDDVALVGGSAGADAILRLATREPELADQLILLSPNSTVEGLGTEPKLFIASKEEPVAHVSSELADASPGDHNKAILLPGSAHAQNIFDGNQSDRTLDAILQRIDQFSDSRHETS